MNTVIKGNNKGEIASLLTVFSMMVIGLGLVVGYNLSQNNRAQTTRSEAQSAPQYNPITSPVDRFDDVCFPGSDKQSRTTDPYCRTRMFPIDFTATKRNADSAATSNFRDILGNPPAQNPHVIKITSDTPRTARVYGGLCFTKEGSTTNTTSTTKVWLSLFDVRKVQDAQGNVTVVANDINEAKNFEIVAADSTTGGRNSLMFANSSKPVCVFTKGLNPNTSQAYAPDNADNPMLFRMDVSLDLLEQKINAAKTPPTDSVRQRVFNTEDCSIYVHQDSNVSNAPKDTYNIFRIPLEDVVDQATKERLCPGITPSVTPSATPTDIPDTTVTPSVTPSVTASPTPSIVPPIFSCFRPDDMNEKGCRSTSQCESTNEAGEALECYEVALKVGSGRPVPITPDPRLPQPDDDDSTDGSLPESQSGLSIPTATGTCEANDTCRCLPKRCLTSDCTTYPKACQNITPTPTVTPPPPVACEYKALAFIEECTQLNPDGTCAIDPQNPSRFMAKPIDEKDLTMQWAPLNEKMRANSEKQDRYFTKQGSTVVKNKYEEVLKGTDELRFRNVTPNTSERATIEGNPNVKMGGFKYFFNTGMLNKGLTYSLFKDSQELPSGSNPLTADAEIKHGMKNDSLRYPEVYNNKNKTNAEVKFYFDKDQYRVVPGGNKIYSCVNDLKNIKDGVGACNNPANQPDEAATRDRVQGLTVGCGQEIVYGVTLQKCDFNYDYLFLVDTSSSMTKPEDDDPNEEGPNKLTAAAKQLESYVNDINSTTPQSRVAVAYFNSGIGFDANTTSQVLLNFTSLETGRAQALNAVTYNSLFNVTREGTCIRCGFETAKKLIDNRTDKSRRPVVILLSDGNVNEFPGQTQDIAAQTQQTKNAAVTLWNSGNTTLVAIGYGDGGANASQTERVNWKEIINEVASVRKDGQTRWSYATAPEIATGGVARSLNEVVKEVQQDLNSCATADLAYKEFIKASDINKDGVINSLDLLMLYDNYAKRGENLPEDVNKDRVVNALDSSLVIQNYGKVVETALAPATGGLTNPAELDTTPAN